MTDAAAPGRDGFLNGVLRGYGKKREALKLPDRESNLVDYLSVRYSFDSSIVKLWLSQFGEDETEQLLANSNMRPPVSVRVNVMKTSIDDLAESLKKLGFEVIPSLTNFLFAKKEGFCFIFYLVFLLQRRDFIKYFFCFLLEGNCFPNPFPSKNSLPKTPHIPLPPYSLRGKLELERKS